jgi:hypothetical protein
MKLSFMSIAFVLLTAGTFAQQQEVKSATLIFYREGHFGGSAHDEGEMAGRVPRYFLGGDGCYVGRRSRLCLHSPLAS